MVNNKIYKIIGIRHLKRAQQLVGFTTSNKITNYFLSKCIRT